jgi:hypothetical protein
MKKNPLAAVLVGVLLVCGPYALWLSIRHLVDYSRLERLQAEVARVSRTRNAAQALASECVEYGRSNPAMIQLLQQYQILEKAPAPAPAQPASRPSPR